jgi:hypothetical protein
MDAKTTWKVKNKGESNEAQFLTRAITIFLIFPMSEPIPLIFNFDAVTWMKGIHEIIQNTVVY